MFLIKVAKSVLGATCSPKEAPKVEPTWAPVGAEAAPREYFHRYDVVFRRSYEGVLDQFGLDFP